MILFVCTGNTCRSPLAAALARQKGVNAQSAGLCALPGDGATPQAQRAAARRGADLSAHRAQPVTLSLLNQAERVFAMTESHARALRAFSPENAHKITLLTPQIPDPFGGDDLDYERCAQALLIAMARAGIL